MHKRRDIGRGLAIIVHIHSVRRIFVVDSRPVVQKTSYPSALDQARGGHLVLSKSSRRMRTHRMLLTSFPTLFAYAPWSLESFVVRLILKKTSSPEDETTCHSLGSARYLLAYSDIRVLLH